MQRRIERLQSLLQTSTTLTFIRKGHAPHHHPEVLKHNLTIKNEIDDANELATFLKNNYLHLSFKIILVLVCDNCYDPNINYTTLHDNIVIYNIASSHVDDNKFSNLFEDIIKIHSN